MIVRLGREHVAAVARLHRASLTGLLSDLGLTAIEAFYAGCARTSLALGLVYLEEDVVKGFVLGSVNPQRLRQEAMRKNWVGTLGGVILGILRRPSTLPSLLRSVGGSQASEYDRNAAELIYIAVSAESRESGIGAQLLKAFTEQMSAMGVAEYELSVDDGNRGAAAFYERRGFVLCGRYKEFGSMHRRYRLRIS